MIRRIIAYTVSANTIRHIRFIISVTLNVLLREREMMLDQHRSIKPFRRGTVALDSRACGNATCRCARDASAKHEQFIWSFSSGSKTMSKHPLAAQRVAGGVELLWQTESEVNAYGFMIERDDVSTGSPVWTDIAFVPAEGGDMMRQTYRHIDDGASDATREYRYPSSVETRGASGIVRQSGRGVIRVV
ncbi:MAG: hypothetical protein KFH87_02650 [Bacteroidetes bacterium]|nr:hypothetical protein [Bacteroidota bacterium]